jgi:hypothetical protein
MFHLSGEIMHLFYRLLSIGPISPALNSTSPVGTIDSDNYLAAKHRMLQASGLVK